MIDRFDTGGYDKDDLRPLPISKNKNWKDEGCVRRQDYDRILCIETKVVCLQV